MRRPEFGHCQPVAKPHDERLNDMTAFRDRREKVWLVGDDDAIVAVENRFLPRDLGLTAELAMEPDEGVGAVRLGARPGSPGRGGRGGISAGSLPAGAARSSVPAGRVIMDWECVRIRAGGVVEELHCRSLAVEECGNAVT